MGNALSQCFAKRSADRCINQKKLQSRVINRRGPENGSDCERVDFGRNRKRRPMGKRTSKEEQKRRETDTNWLQEKRDYFFCGSAAEGSMRRSFSPIKFNR